MKWTEITEGAELYCPNCDQYMGKPSENDEDCRCGNCGTQFHNNGGIKRYKMSDIKFGRLVLTDLEEENGSISGTLKTSKGQTLGSIVQYGPEWYDYDNGKWEAYCSANKANKKGFPDKKKAVEWIVRQTRVSMKSNVTEGFGEHMVFGHSIPVWGQGGDDDAALFSGAGRMVEILVRNGNYEVWNANSLIYKTQDTDALEQRLSKYRLTKFEGIQGFSRTSETIH